MNTIISTGYLADLLNEIPAENYLMLYIFQRMDEARQSAVAAARRGNVRKFRYAFMSVSKEIACRQYAGVPNRGYNRHTVSEKDYAKYVRLFETVSRTDAGQFYGVAPEEYDEWMAEWTMFYFYTGRSPIFSLDVREMDFPSEEIAQQQTGSYPGVDEHEGNSDLWEEEFRSLYDSIDDDPNLFYRIRFVGAICPDKTERPSFLEHCFDQ